MSIRYYTTESSFAVLPAAPLARDPDSGSDLSLSYESPKSTYSDQPRKKKSKRVRFVDDSGLNGFNNLGFPGAAGRDTAWKDRGWTPRYMVRLWQERYLEYPSERAVRERDFWFKLGFDWGWDSLWSLDVERKVKKTPSFWSSGWADSGYVRIR